MIRVEHLNLREIRMPLVEPFEISSGVVEERRIFLIQVADEDGFIGWGECAAGETPNYSPETISTAWLAIREWVAPRIVGHSFDHPGEIYSALQKDFRGHLMAKAAVEMACWDLFAKREEISLSKLLGGTRSHIETGISIGIQKSSEILVEKARKALAEGYRKIKMKIKPGADIEFVKAVREALGPEAPLMADANNAYSLEDSDRLAELDGFGLLMIEQPLAWDDVVRHSTLQRRLKTPICLDESITSIDKARDMVELKSGRIVNIKPSRVGGHGSSILIHDYCRSESIPVWCGGMLESGVGRAHNVALASLENFTLPGDVSPSHRYWEQDIVTPPWTMDAKGRVEVPRDRPGIGVEVDLDRVEDLTVYEESLNLQKDPRAEMEG